MGYADIIVLGTLLPGTFVSKAEVARWPIIGFLASIAGGETILPFKTAPFAAVAGLSGKTVLPIHIDVVEIEGLSATGSLRDAVCWYGDAAFAPHIFRLLGLRDIRYRVVIGRPIPCEGRDRKMLAVDSREKIVALGRISARQGCLFPGDFIRIRSVS